MKANSLHLLLRSLWNLTNSALSSSVSDSFFEHSSVGPCVNNHQRQVLDNQISFERSYLVFAHGVVRPKLTVVHVWVLKTFVLSWKIKWQMCGASSSLVSFPRPTPRRWPLKSGGEPVYHYWWHYDRHWRFQPKDHGLSEQVDFRPKSAVLLLWTKLFWSSWLDNW